MPPSAVLKVDPVPAKVLPVPLLSVFLDHWPLSNAACDALHGAIKSSDSSRPYLEKVGKCKN